MHRLTFVPLLEKLVPICLTIGLAQGILLGQEIGRPQIDDRHLDTEDATDPTKAEDQRTRQLIVELASPDFLVRQNATQSLFRLGQTNRDLIIEATRLPDREVAKRASDLLKIYEMGIDSETPPEIGNLVLFFYESGLEIRGQVLSLLISQNRFRLVFDLLGQVTEPDKQKELYQLAFGLNDTLLRLARENQWEDIEFLLAHPLTFKHDPIACSYYHLVSGKLDELINRLEIELGASRQDGKSIADQDHLTLASLYRLQRNHAEAISHAEQIEDTTLRFELIRQVLMEQGDWQSIADRMVLPEENLNPTEGKLAFTLSQQVLVHRFLNNHDKVQELLRQLADKSFELSKQNNNDENAENFRRLVTQLALAVADWSTASTLLDDSNRLETFELYSYLNRPSEAFTSVDLGDSLDERIVWTRRRIRNMQSLEKKIQRQEENDLDSDAATEDLTKTWNLSCEMVRQLGSFGFREEALLHYRELFEAIGEGRTVWQRRGDIIEGLITLGKYEEVWKLVERAIPESEHNHLMTFLFPYKRATADYWNNQLVKRYPDGLTRLRKVAALVNSPLAGSTQVDVDEELAIALGKSKLLSGKLDFQVARILQFHGRADESQLHLEAASSLSDILAREKLALTLLEDGEYAAAAEIYDQALRQQRGALNARMAAEAYRKLGQRQTAALRDAIAFVYWHESYRSESIISSFAEIDRLDRMQNFLQVYVCVPGSERVSDERYRGALSSALQNVDPANEAICLQILLITLFNTDNPSSRRLAWWAQTARQLTLARAATEIAQHNYVAAMEELLAYNRFRPGDPDVVEKLVPMLDAAGESDRADRLFDLVNEFYFDMLRQYPGSPLYHNNYAWICACGKRRIQYAMRHCQVALQANPMNSSYLDTLAEIFFLQGNIDAAIETSRKCTFLNPRKFHYQKQLRRFLNAKSMAR